MGKDCLTIPTPVLSGSGVRVLVAYSVYIEILAKSQPCGTPWLTFRQQRNSGRSLSVCLFSASNFTIIYIAFILEIARLLAALIRPNHLVRLSSWGSFIFRRRAIPMILGISLNYIALNSA